ncbi:MAG: gliding motility protein GldM [Bacteroidia bacterium]|nr:gliding motility protein GldM [Bacteroidia bacterium]
MASGKETPRQKMIGMMYLVLTALLALNVSKEILNAFVVVNESLGKTTGNFTVRNDKLYADFDLAKSVDPIRVTPNWKKAEEVKKQSKALDEYITKLKKEIVMKTEGLEASVADTLQLAFVKNKDNNTITTHLMIGESEDGSKGYSRELKNKLLAYKSLLTSFIDPKDKNKVDIGMVIEDPKHSETNENWELYNFYDTPLAAAITILSKLQNDVKNAESVTVDYLLKQFDNDIVKFDTIAPKVIPQSNYVLLGEDYKADVFIAAFSKTQKPNVLAHELNMNDLTANGKPDTLPVSQGIGKYVNKTLREGIFKWGGTISLRSSSGKNITYPFQSEYVVARPAINVSADKMNVFYMGVENPITIAVPGIPNERITPSISTGNLKGLGNGKYIVTGVSGKKAVISVTATLENGEKRNMGSIDYRVKPLPKPYPQCGSVANGGRMKLGELRVQEVLSAKYDPNFDFAAKCTIKSFKIIGYKSGQLFEFASNTNKFTPDMKNVFDRLNRNDKIFVTEIKALGGDNNIQSLNEMMIQLY